MNILNVIFVIITQLMFISSLALCSVQHSPCSCEINIIIYCFMRIHVSLSVYSSLSHVNSLHANITKYENFVIVTKITIIIIVIVVVVVVKRYLFRSKIQIVINRDNNEFSLGLLARVGIHKPRVCVFTFDMLILFCIQFKMARWGEVGQCLKSPIYPSSGTHLVILQEYLKLHLYMIII